ncbi:MAG: hypothetical protein NVS9B6_18160 [Candidatus Limnocylindrales bacterium]
MGSHARQDFTADLEDVARGVRRLEEIRDPVLRDAIAAALRLRQDDPRLDPAARARMRRQVLAAVGPASPTFVDTVMTVFALLAKPAPVLLRLLAIVLVGAGLLAGATVASADSLPDEALYGFKLAGEQLRLAIASTPEDRAAVGISIAGHRLDEAERLAEAGRDDATIEVTAAYGLSLATAAAELASVETLQPKLAALVAQLQTQLKAQQVRVGVSAARLARDPRTAGAAAALAAAGPHGGSDSTPSAVSIADTAAAVTSRLAAVAGSRAAAPRAAEPAETPTDRRGRSVRTAGRAAPTIRPASPPFGQTSTRSTPAPVDHAAAREAAQRAQHAAEEAQRAAARAHESGRHTHSPTTRIGIRLVTR